MSDQHSLPFWKKLPALMFNRLNGRSGGSSDQEVTADEHKPLNVFHRDYDINKLDTPLHRILMSQALVYRERIEALIGGYPTTSGRDVLIPIARQVEVCVSGLYQLAQSLEIASSASTPPPASEQTDVVTTPDPAQVHETAVANVLAEPDTTDSPTEHLPILDPLTQGKFEERFEDTLTMLGTAYSLMLLLDGKEVDESRAQHLRDLLSRYAAPPINVS